MNRARIVLWAGLTTVSLVACKSDSPTSLSLEPFRDGWQLEVDTEFPHQDDAGVPGITSIVIGGPGDEGNFANRGDVIVEFDDAYEDRITVEMRRFAWVDDEDAAADGYEKLRLWAYSATPIKPPGEMDPASNCNPGDGSAWQDDCTIRVYYEGQLEPRRFGADLRVTLPADYRHSVQVVTSDNDYDDDYLNRGNVCVDGLNGSVDVELEQGVAYVILDPDTGPVPSCPPEDIEQCENWTDEDDQPAPWAGDCPCMLLGYGRAVVRTVGKSAADITFDVGSTLWASLSLENSGDNQTESGHHCNADVDWPRAQVTDYDPWKLTGSANVPDAAPAGGGFGITGEATACAAVSYTEDPDDFVGEGGGDEQTSELRGNLKVCNDCLRGKSCDELLPGE
jgi:hypothetical protein